MCIMMGKAGLLWELETFILLLLMLKRVVLHNIRLMHPFQKCQSSFSFGAIFINKLHI